MKQIIQDIKSGKTILEEVPAPQAGKGEILIRTTRSLVSLGTEKMLVEFGKANLIQKARQQPDKVKQVLEKIRAEGLLPTLEAVFNKLDQPLPLGYCNVGRVVAVGEGVVDFKIGDRVASNGHHAEYVCVPQNLVAAVPDEVTDEEAAFTVIGAIGLQGIRLCSPSLGETVVVIGLGLVGLMTAELLLTNGCRVIGIEPDSQKLEIARSKGITCINPAEGTEPVKFVTEVTGGVGADGVIITASAKTNEIISQAAQMSRKRGRIILVGVVGLNISRADFYEKELTFQVSCSYGPGRYDEEYEQRGTDYPLPYVRWTEKRNFQAVLDAMAAGRLNVASLITERVALNEYRKIYDQIGNSGSIASIIEYPGDNKPDPVVSLRSGGFNRGEKGIGIIGAGNFTRMTLLPALRKAGGPVVSIASSGGLSGTLLAKKYGIAKSVSDYREILSDPAVGMVMITTRHNTHAEMVIESLEAGKHVFVEKPLALSEDELSRIVAAYKGDKTLTVGFNRRFSPHIRKVKSLTGLAPMNVTATMNAGYLPPEAWPQDMKIGGGRIVGEACHYIDLLIYLTGSKVKSVCMNALGAHPGENTDNASILLAFENGSTGVVNYFSNGSRSYSKERIEVYTQGRTIVVDNFRVTKAYGFRGFSRLKTRLDKGHKGQFELLTRNLALGGPALIPFDELVNSSKASLAALESLRTQSWIPIG